MFETDDQLRWLRELLDQSHGGGGAHIGSIVTPERRLTPQQVVNYLQIVKHVVFATVTAKGEPFVSPLDALFLHGRFWVSTSDQAVKAKHVLRQPAVSACHMVGDDIGIWVHGRVERMLREGDPAVVEYDRVATSIYKSSPFSWGPSVIVMPIEPRKMFAYAFHPENFE